MFENIWQWITLIKALQWHVSRGGIYCPASEQSVLEFNVLEVGKMGRQKDIGQIVKAWWLGQRISWTSSLVSNVQLYSVNTYKKCYKKGTYGELASVNGCPRFTNAQAKWRLVHLVQSYRRAGVAWIAEKLNTGHSRKLPACITACWVCGRIAADHSECPWWPLSTTESVYNEHVSIRPGPWRNGRRLASLMDQVLLLIRMARWVCIIYLGKRWQQDALRRQ